MGLVSAGANGAPVMPGIEVVVTLLAIAGAADTDADCWGIDAGGNPAAAAGGASAASAVVATVAGASIGAGDAGLVCGTSVVGTGATLPTAAGEGDTGVGGVPGALDSGLAICVATGCADSIFSGGRLPLARAGSGTASIGAIRTGACGAPASTLTGAPCATVAWGCMPIRGVALGCSIGAGTNGVGATVGPGAMATAFGATSAASISTGISPTGTGIGAACGMTGTCGCPTIASCGVAPPLVTCNCSAVPAGKPGNCALMTISPIRSAVMPSGSLPSTIASSTCPGVNTGASVAVARAKTAWASDETVTAIQ